MKTGAAKLLSGILFALALSLSVFAVENPAAQALSAVPEAVYDSVYQNVYEINPTPVIAQQDVLLSEVYLKVPDDPGGLHNAALAAEKINGTIVLPGAVFSFNKVVGERTTENGFVLGPVVTYSRHGYRMGQDIGGGVCRTSTAVHQAVLKAGLKVIERHSHSIPVEYAEPGSDAAVYWGVWDYRFLNNTQYSVKVAADIQDDIIDVQLYSIVPVTTNLRIFLDGQEVLFPGAKPFVLNGVTYVPPEFFEKNFGLEIAWDRLAKAVSVEGKDGPVELPVGALFTEETAMIPLRCLAERLGAALSWQPGKTEIESRRSDQNA
ncbi:MAG TPA: hypothetical protein GXX19_05640 [Syntrophomonadaceae bacterium]|nr:hypothetical protein [Syntrophomonadaceae bacterium]